MSLDKAIAHGKEKRKPYYRRAKQMSHSCRNHGSCTRCMHDRTIAQRRIQEQAEIELQMAHDETPDPVEPDIHSYEHYDEETYWDDWRDPEPDYDPYYDDEDHYMPDRDWFPSDEQHPDRNILK